MDRQTFEAELVRDGYEVVENGMRPGTFNPDHEHPFDARLFVLDGEITVAFDGESKTCRAGDSFALAAFVTHSETVGPDGVSYVAGRRSPGA